MERLRQLNKWLPFCLIDIVIIPNNNFINIHINKKLFGYYKKDYQYWWISDHLNKYYAFNNFIDDIISKFIKSGFY